jgi:6-pyruvoyltetrahydropterin/6-carboxytetrahydropterin synthase
MSHYLLSAEATFSAAHTLPGVDMCDRMHGHNWRVRLTVRVEEDSIAETGMGVDFRVIEDIAKASVADFEHQYLNDLEPFKGHTPSAERLAKVICHGAQERLTAAGQMAAIHQIEVWELPQYRVVYRP